MHNHLLLLSTNSFHFLCLYFILIPFHLLLCLSCFLFFLPFIPIPSFILPFASASLQIHYQLLFFYSNLFFPLLFPSAIFLCFPSSSLRFFSVLSILMPIPSFTFVFIHFFLSYLFLFLCFRFSTPLILLTSSFPSVSLPFFFLLPLLHSITINYFSLPSFSRSFQFFPIIFFLFLLPLFYFLFLLSLFLILLFLLSLFPLFFTFSFSLSPISFCSFYPSSKSFLSYCLLSKFFPFSSSLLHSQPLRSSLFNSTFLLAIISPCFHFRERLSYDNFPCNALRGLALSLLCGKKYLYYGVCVFLPFLCWCTLLPSFLSGLVSFLLGFIVIVNRYH